MKGGKLDYTLSIHCSQMLDRRKIEVALIESAIDAPDRIVNIDSNERHYIKRIEDTKERWLRVIVNPTTDPLTIITAFYDRRLKK